MSGDISSNPRSREIGRHVNDYDTALRFLGGKYEKKLANNTLVRRSSQWEGPKEKRTEALPDIQVILHRTPVVTYYPDGRVELNSGGYRSVTTKQRINQLLPPGFGLEQRKYDWYVRAPDGSKQDFFEGIMLQGPLPEAAREKLLSLSRRMTKPERPGHMPNPARRSKYGRGTWLDAEELAYASYDEHFDAESNETDYDAALLDSDRRFRAIDHESGVHVEGRCGIPDTWFSIPAITDRGVEGYVTSSEEGGVGGTSFVEFRRYTGK